MYNKMKLLCMKFVELKIYTCLGKGDEVRETVRADLYSEKSKSFEAVCLMTNIANCTEIFEHICGNRILIQSFNGMCLYLEPDVI